MRLFGLEFDFEVLLPAAYVSFKDVGEFFFFLVMIWKIYLQF